VKKEIDITPAEAMLNANSGVEVPMRPERRTLVVMALVFLPWIAVVLFTAGGWAALNLLGYAIIVIAAGYSIISVTLPAPARSQTIVLAPATGILAISALTAFWVRLGLPLIWAPTLWLALTATGVLGFWRDRTHWMKSTVAFGLTLALFSSLICAVYFLPSACNDLVQRRDGSFNWRFIDTQHFHSLAASIKDSGSPPKTPGTFTAELLYHFGPYAPAAAISRLDGLYLGDAVARVTRGGSLWALVLSCFGVGTLLSLKATNSKFGGIMSVAGLFFYGSLLSLFTAERTTLGHMAGAILFKIPNVEVAGDGGPFTQLLGGHSVLHGLGAITAIMGLCLFRSERESALSWRELALLALPALAVAVNSVAALYCLGVVGILLFWGHLGTARSWMSLMLMGCLFFGAWRIMGYSHSPDTALATINYNVAWQRLTVWFIVGLGFRIVGFRWISLCLRDRLSVLVLASVLGFLAFSLLLQLRDSNQRYGIYFLQCILSILAFSRVTSGCWHTGERSRMMVEWLRLARNGMILLVACGIMLRIIVYATHSAMWVASFRLMILPSLLLVLLFGGLLELTKRSRRFSIICSAVLMGALAVGFLAWITPWFRFGFGAVKTDITYTPGEVRGLRRLGELMTPNERFATNKHDLERVSPLPPLALSYGYSALSERPVLLEGYLARGETALPWFKTLLRDNDLFFSTTDPETLHNIARAWHVRWLVARPGTDISLARPLPPWLIEQQNCGDLKIYKID
jgi:hypothetical protein